nr:uroporphyrinogen decarboxylase family protein [Candidatus Sigynarchaeum springense]
MPSGPDFDRLLKVLWRERPDRVPFYEHLFDDGVIEAITGQPIPKYHEPLDDGDRGSAARDRRLKRKAAYIAHLASFCKGLGFDFVPIEVGPKLFRLNVETSHRAEPLGRSSRGWVDNYRSTIANLEELEEYEWPEPADAVDYELLESARGTLPPGMKLVAGVGGGVQEHVLWLVGLQQLSIELKREPLFVKRIFDKVGSLIVEVDKVIAAMEHVGALKSGDDMGYKKATLLSPKTLRENAFPWQARIAKAAHDNGKPFILHSCGNLAEIMEDLIRTVKIGAIHSFQDVIYPVTVAKERWGDKIALLGGVDVDVLARETVDEVIAYTRNVLAKCMPGGGYALGTGNSVTNYVKIVNYKAMLDTGWKYGLYR